MGQSGREHSLWERITLWLVSGRTLVLLLIHGSNLSGHTASKYASSIWTYTNSTSKTFYSTLPLASNKTNPIRERSVILTIGNYFHGIDKIQKSIQVSLKFRLTKLHVCHPSGLTKNCAHIQDDIHTFFKQNGPSSASFSFIFGLFQTNNTISQQIMLKMVIQYPVLGFELTTF